MSVHAYEDIANPRPADIAPSKTRAHPNYEYWVVLGMSLAALLFWSAYVVVVEGAMLGLFG